MDLSGNKELFINILKEFKLQKEHDKKCSDAFKVILPSDYISCYDNSKLYESVIKLLSFISNDKSEWVSYYVYDLDFGNNRELEVFFNGNYIKMETPEDVWDCIKLTE